MEGDDGKRRRLMSLDALRGFDMLLIMGLEGDDGVWHLWEGSDGRVGRFDDV